MSHQPVAYRSSAPRRSVTLSVVTSPIFAAVGLILLVAAAVLALALGAWVAAAPFAGAGLGLLKR